MVLTIDQCGEYLGHFELLALRGGAQMFSDTVIDGCAVSLEVIDLKGAVIGS